MVDKEAIFCECNKQMGRIIVPANTHVFEPYYDHNLACDDFPEGVFVKSERHKRKLMKKAKVEYLGRKPGMPGSWV